MYTNNSFTPQREIQRPRQRRHSDMYSQYCRDAMKKSMFNETGYKIEKMSKNLLEKEKIYMEFFETLKQELLSDYYLDQLIEKIEFNAMCLYIYPRENFINQDENVVSQYDCIRINIDGLHDDYFNNLCENRWGGDEEVGSVISISLIMKKKLAVCQPVALFHYWKNTLFNLDYSNRKHSNFTCVCSNACNYCNLMYERHIKNLSQIDLPSEQECILHKYKKCKTKECMLYGVDNSDIFINHYCSTNYVSSKSFKLAFECAGAGAAATGEAALKITHYSKFKKTICDIILNNMPVASENIANHVLNKMGRAENDY